MGCCRITDLRRKEVINNKTGCRIGFVDDVEVDTVTAKLVAIVIFGRWRCFGLLIVIFGRWRCFGLLGKEENIVIKWENICLIGEDTILVDYCQIKRERRKWNFPFF